MKVRATPKSRGRFKTDLHLDVANGSIDNATLSLLPGETALITLRGNVDVAAMKEIVSKVTPVAVAHAANTGTTEPAFSAPLTIRTTSLPDAIFRAITEPHGTERAQQAGQRKIPHFLNVPVAHKTGENTGVTHDAGLIYARAGTVVMVSRCFRCG